MPDDAPVTSAVRRPGRPPEGAGAVSGSGVPSVSLTAVLPTQAACVRISVVSGLLPTIAGLPAAHLYPRLGAYPP
ncbi:hypothetical protein GCM10027570_05420 [Streptomonospora sediminis]